MKVIIVLYKKQEKERTMKRTGLLTALVIAMIMLLAVPAYASENFWINADYLGITLEAGESMTYELDFHNMTDRGTNAKLTVESIPDGWTGYFKGEENYVYSAYCKPGDTYGPVYFTVETPKDAAGVHHVVIRAECDNGEYDEMDMELNVEEIKYGSSSLSTDFTQQDITSGTKALFSTTIQNNRPTEQMFSFTAQVPEGWSVVFRESGKETAVSTMSVPAKGSTPVMIDVIASNTAESGDYDIPVSIVSAMDKLSETYHVKIRGTYNLFVTTPTGRLSFDANAKKPTSQVVQLKNVGNINLENINLTAVAPPGWSYEFSEPTVDLLEPGQLKEVTMTVTPGSDIVNGDYALQVKAETVEIAGEQTFRITVKTETMWGIVGILVILAACAGLVLVFRKYGRR